MEIEKHAVDRGLWTKGKWITYSPDGDAPAEFLIAGWGNPDHIRAIGELIILSIAKRDDESEAQRQARVAHAYREAEITAIPGTVLRGWRGMTSKGKEVPFSVEAAQLVLPRMPAVLNFVRLHSKAIRTFQTEAEADLGKALALPSPGEPESLPT